ncbi:unnamed protein product [Paramecium sonneborni]|uniref:Uncharacterized protein n=1 Tax=Paramecium sonneborni TaxID=65129 RepID=A0A8S1LVU3_9CILI|nr:unnamed protein product [Paramecium sonneborni]
MHCFTYYHQNLYLQQQYIHHQMLMYNQMFNTYNYLNQQDQLQVTYIPDQIKFPHSQNHKNEDTPPIQQQNSIPLKKKINKVSKKHSEHMNEENKPQKKKVFLSMLDIKEAQYKKCSKVSNLEGLFQNTILGNKIKE